jgi:glycosyltransferase involved in cell wall biosynthesis
VRLLTVTDLWWPQVCGVVRAIEATREALLDAGHPVTLITPETFTTVAWSRHARMRWSVLPGARVAEMLDHEATEAGPQPLAIHIATTGPLALAARRHCIRRGWPFTTTYRPPAAGSSFLRPPQRWISALLARFHSAATRVLSPSPSADRELAALGLTQIVRWSRGVDLDLFRPEAEAESTFAAADSPLAAVDSTQPAGVRPRFLYVGRLSAERRVAEYLRLDLPGEKIVAGDGPALALLRRRHPEVRVLGILPRRQLAALYASCDVLVLPGRSHAGSTTLLEALACGTPVASRPLPGMLDLVGTSSAAALNSDLRVAALRALALDRAQCRRHAERFSWHAATEQFLAAQVPITRHGGAITRPLAHA